jgi:hypothetical protein
VVVNAPLTAGAGDITLNGGGLDVIITVDRISATTLNITAPRDIIVKATVGTTAPGADVELIADTDADGIGGVWVWNIGFVDSAEDVFISGSDVFATPGVVDSVRIDGDGVNDQVRAVGNITIVSGPDAPADADILLHGRVHSTGGDIDVTSANRILAADPAAGTALLAADAGNIGLHSAVVLTGDVTAVAAGDITFDSTLDALSAGAQSLDLDAGTLGDIEFVGAVGGTRLGPVTIVTAHDVTISSTFHADSLLQQNGTGTTTVDGATTLDAAAGIDLTTADIHVNALVDTRTAGTGGTVKFTASDDVTLNAEVKSGAGLVDVQADDDVDFTAAGVIRTLGATVTVVAGADAAGGAIFMADGSLIDAGAARVDLIADDSIAVSRVVTTTDVAVTSAHGAISDSGDTGGADIVANQVALRAAEGIGSGDAIETSVNTLAALNTTSGSIRVENFSGGLLTIGTVDGLTGVVNLDGGGDIEIINHSPMTVAANVVNLAGGGITLKALGNGGDDDHLTINAPLLATGAAGDILLDAGTDLLINDTGVQFDVAGKSITGFAGRDVIIAPSVIVQSFTGQVIQPIPLVSAITAPQMESSGRSLVTVDFGRPDEFNFTLSLDRANGDVQTQNITFPPTIGPTSHTFDYTYITPPDPNSPAFFFITLTIVDAPDITFFENGVEMKLDPITIRIDTTGSFFGNAVFDLSVEPTPLEVPRVILTETAALSVATTVDIATTLDEEGASEEEAQPDERVLIIRKVDDEGKVEISPLGDRVELEYRGARVQTIMDDLPGVDQRLRNGRFLFLLKEGDDAQPRLVRDVTLRDGTLVEGGSSDRERPPTGGMKLPEVTGSESASDEDAPPAPPAPARGNGTPTAPEHEADGPQHPGGPLSSAAEGSLDRSAATVGDADGSLPSPAGAAALGAAALIAPKLHRGRDRRWWSSLLHRLAAVLRSFPR